MPSADDYRDAVTGLASGAGPEPPRYAPDRALPPYTYVPARAPHPVTDPAGHSFGRPAPAPSPPAPGEWAACGEYLYGVDLFNRGYYWEAHEAWEAVWAAAGRAGPVADFFKGLIKLAAAGVKWRAANPAGARRHARRARELFARVQAATAGSLYFGLSLDELVAFAETAAAGGNQVPPDDRPRVVFPFSLRPR
jgi:hypothetical protein